MLFHSVKDSGACGVKSYIAQTLAQFDKYETSFYECLAPFDKSAYCSYVGAHRILQTKKPLMPPTEWLEFRSIPMDLESIGKTLGISRGAVSAYLTSCPRRVRKIIAKDPERYKDLIDYIGGLK